MKDEYSGEYLPKPYHYHGMSKIKAGKGYRHGNPLGILGGPCKIEDCTGTIISLKMNISARGFETTSEKVCDTCGTIYPSPYQLGIKIVKDKPPKLHKHHIEKEEEDLALRKYYNSKGEELYHKRNGPYPDGPPEIKKTKYKIEYDYYYYNHDLWKGANSNEPTHEPDSSSESFDDTNKPEPLKDMYYWTQEQVQILGNTYRAKQAIYNNRSKKEVKEYETALRMRLAEAIASGMELNRLQVDQVKYIIDKYGIEYKYRRGTYPMEEVIECLCIYVL